MRIALTAFTARGAELAQTLADRLRARGHACTLAVPARLEQGLPVYESLGRWTGERFHDTDALLFVGASGIAVRAIAPYIRDKFTDPAVVSVDEAGRFSVPLLSGHVGGGNDLARLVATLTGGTAAISTATDVNGKFAVDQWAREQGLSLDGRTAAKHIAAALLAGDSVGVESTFTIQGEPPEGVIPGQKELGFVVTLDPDAAPFDETLRLVPRILNVGVGCRRGTEMAAIETAVDQVFLEHHLSPRAVKQVCTIDLKKSEPGLLAFCQKRGISLVSYTAEELMALPGEFTPSEFVRSITGVDNVCERAAVRAGGELIVRKQAGGGVTVAVSQEPFTVRF